MAFGVDCPTAGKLAGYARNTLAIEDTATVDRHLAQCRACLDRFVELGKRSPVPEVPDCHVVKEIGRGRFGVVYKAWSLKDNPQIVALKLLSCTGEMEEGRFDREIAVLKKIDSPWIVRCHDSGISGDLRYYVMDYVEGVHLDEYLAKSSLDLNGKLAVLKGVCRAVADAHAKGVVHRDLKPRNILVDAQGHPHILDFGVCSVETGDGSTGDRGTITQAGDVIGTLKYMSPEQAWGGVARPIDERSDLWALGVMLYEIVTDGAYPYSLESTPDRPALEALLERIRRELPRLPRLDHLPRGRDLEVLLSRCLAWEPDRRLDSTQKLADDLDRYCRGRRIKTKPLWMPYRLKRLAVGAAVRSRWMLSVAFIATLGVMLWFATYPFNVGWRVTGHQYQGSLDRESLLGPPAGGERGFSPQHVAALPEPGDARESIQIVGVFDDTIEAVGQFASGQRMEGVTPSILTWRAVHGHLMERLALARPKAVVWDYYFRTPQAGDARFVEGVRALEQAGIPVVLASLTYHDDGTPDLSPGLVGPLAGRLRHGAIAARDMVERPGEFVLASKRVASAPPGGGAVVVPGLPLTTLAAVLHPATLLELDWTGRMKRIDLLYELEPGAYLRERDPIEFTRVFNARHAEGGVRAGDLLGCGRFVLQRPERWEPRTVSYQTLLTCSDDELQASVRDKLLVFGDFRTSRFGFSADLHRVKYGTSIIPDVPGCYLLADAFAGLLDRRYMKSAFPLPPDTFLLMLAVALAGCLLPIGLAKSKALEQPQHRRLLWIALPSLAALCFLVMVLSDRWAAVHLGMAGFALLLPMAGSFWVEFARNRHRIVERDRRAIQDYDLTAEGTLTLPSRRRKPPREARG